MRALSRAVGIVVLTAVAPAHAQLSPEFSLDLPERNDVAAEVDSADFDGTDYFVIWQDSRYNNSPFSPTGVTGARLTTSGTLRDPAGLPVVANGDAQPRARIAFTAGVHLVAWQPVDARTILTVRVQKDGAVLDAMPMEMLGAAAENYDVALAASVDTFLVCGANGAVACQRMTPQGLVLDPAPIVLSGNGAGVSAASDGTDFLVAWVDATSGSFVATVARVSSTGFVLGPSAPIGAAQFRGQTAVSYGAGEYLLAFPGLTAVDVTRLSPAAIVLDPMPIQLAPGISPVAAFDGVGFIVAYLVGGPRAVHISAAGVLGATDLVATVTNVANDVALATDGDAGAAVFWTGDIVDVLPQYRLQSRTVDGTRLSATSALDLPPILVSALANDELSPWVMASHGHFVASWLSQRSYPYPSTPVAAQVIGAQTSMTGAFALATSGGPPRYASDTMVVWSDGNLTAGFLGNAGILPAVTLSIGPAADQFAACGDLIVWRSAADRIVATRVNRDAGVLDKPELALGSDVIGPQTDPAVAQLGSRYLAVWQQPGQGVDHDVFGQWVTADGVVSSRRNGGIAIATTAADETAPDVAASEGALLVVFREGPRSISAARFGIDGGYAHLHLVDAQWDIAEPHLARVGQRWLLVWAEAHDAGGDIAGAWLDDLEDGGVGAARFGVTTSDEDERAPRVAGDETGAAMIVFQRFVRSLSAQRLFGRRLEGAVPRSPLGDACDAGTSCSSGQCIDGVCCDSACGGGDVSDCMACAVAAGGHADGTCAPVLRGRSCRAAGSVCDQEEVCDGTALVCPANDAMPDGTVCDDGDPTTGGDRCLGGRCTGDGPSTCAGGDTCAQHRCGCAAEPGLTGALALAVLLGSRGLRRPSRAPEHRSRRLV